MTETSPQGRIRRETDGAIGRLILDNPARHNAMTLAMWQAIPSEIAALVADPAIRVIILAGVDGLSFASGADISEFDTVRKDADSSRAYEAANAAAFAAVRQAGKPTIAMIRRYCIGGGVGLAIAADLRIAADDAVFAIPAGKLGLAYPPEAVADIVHLLGPAVTKDLFYTARRVDAAEALRLGLVGQVVPAAELEAAAKAMAEGIAQQAPMTLTAVKAAIAAASDPRLTDTALRLADAYFNSADYVEGRAAFREKRPPQFKGY